MSEYKIYKTHVALFWWSNDDLKGPANVSVAIPIKKWFENYDSGYKLYNSDMAKEITNKVVEMFR